MPLSRYAISFPDPQRPGFTILYSTRKGSLVRVSEQLLTAITNNTLTDEERATLQQLQLWTNDLDAERSEMAAIVDHTNSHAPLFSATVVLTLACNLACPYCFEEPFRDGQEMTEETGRVLVDYLIRNHLDQGRNVELRFYGGEPLMATTRLKEIATPLLAAAANAGKTFSFSLVTNATLLTRAMVEELLPLGLKSAIITLDGPPEIHDQQRPFVSGKGSFKTIIDNLAAVYDLVTIKPGGNFTRDNYRCFPEMLDLLLEAGIDPSRLGPVQFSPIHPKSGLFDPHAAACVLPNEPWLIEANLFLREEILRRGFAMDKLQMGICMIDLEQTLVVNYDGSLYKCPSLMGWPEFCVGTLAEGVSDYQESHRLDIWKNDECLDCAYLPICFGGCRLLTLQKNGAIDTVECHRPMLDASLERLVLQDLGTRKPDLRPAC
ncbi:uncharacterized protein SAMN02745119_01282 [Trichlorobacter thiogenes]|uniref:Radical SAM core domain-containing protein n=1 Tax=Trichlorobacter thiogenes TaxID=115783 RepID=A0A1T4MGR9_9BACT|nr:geopeptide radical SAM maturase [Trichlorobacter thiogenes]SJZ65978.1 uncharacterized protein SAMN02745119_01282 [Trichlorobacter thiogenes]